MMDDLDRFHLVMDVIDRVPALGSRATILRQQMVDARLAARAYTREHGEDDPGNRRLDLAAQLGSSGGLVSELRRVHRGGRISPGGVDPWRSTNQSR